MTLGATKRGPMFQPGETTSYLEHEVNQPLAAILMNAAAALRWLDREQPDLVEVRQAVERIVGNGHRACTILRGASAAARPLPDAMSRLDINDTIEDMLDLMRLDLLQRDVAVETELAADLAPVRGNRDQLQQVVVNLATNGIEAMNTVEDRQRKLKFSTRLASPGSVLVSVEDSGTGFDPAIAGKLFNPRFTTKPDGLGIGLSICRSIVQAHGGRLWAAPNTPHGSIFRFVVPTAIT